MITNSKLVFEIKEKKSRDEVLELISEKLVEQKIASSSKTVLKGLIAREKQTTTGLQDGIAIPHVSSSVIKEAKIVVAKLKHPTDWNSLDGKPADFIIAIAVPASGRNEHFNLLTKISAKLADSKFIVKLKKETKKNIVDIFNSIKTEKEVKKTTSVKSLKSTSKTSKKPLNVVGVTTCVTGVAHTFMAAEALEAEGKKRGWNIKIEKQGQMTKDALTAKEIADADYVIIAKSKSIDSPERFAGKKVYTTEVAKPITKAKEVLDDMLEHNVLQKGSSASTIKSTGEKGKQSKGKEIMSHLMAGISYAIPYIAMAGITLGIVVYFGYHKVGAKGHEHYVVKPNGFWQLMDTLAAGGFKLYIPILGMMIANSIAGRKAMAPAAILSLVFNTGIDPKITAAQFAPFFNWHNMSFMFKDSPALGFLGGVAAGYMTGYGIKFFTKYTDKINSQAFQTIVPLLIIPILFTVIPYLFMAFFGYLPLYYLALGLKVGVVYLAKHKMLWIAGGIMGMMICFDLGGPVNKIAMVIGVMMLGYHNESSILNGVAGTAVSIPAVVLLFSLIFEKISPIKMDKQDKTGAATASVMGFFGITEGAIPFAAKNPKKWVPSFMFAGLVGGIFATFTGVVDNIMMWGGPIIWLVGGFGSIHNPAGQTSADYIRTLWYFLPLIGAGFAGFLLASFLDVFYDHKDKKAKKEDKAMIKKSSVKKTKKA